ncbi:MAG: hypothetical protein R2792_18220, partial [Saprospiraceae bacterium]
FTAEDFFEIGHSGQEGVDHWLHSKDSRIEFAVKIEDGTLILGEATSEQSFFELADGKLEIINRGEFGGALNFIPKKNPSDTSSICKAPIDFVFEFKDQIYFVAGSSHGVDQGGGLFRLLKTGNRFTYEEVLRLDSAPEAIAIYKGLILIAGYSKFIIIDNFKAKNIIEEALWDGHYPNSIAVKNEEEVYIGMRSGYSKVSLLDGEVKYYHYQEF